MKILITIREERLKGLEALKTAERFMKVISWLNKRYDREFKAHDIGYSNRDFVNGNVTVLIKD